MIKNNSFGFRYISGGFYSLLIIFTILFSISFSGPAVGEIAGPGWFAGTADPVSHEDAQAYYASKREGVRVQALPGTMVMGVSSSTSASLEITELARALRYNPRLIYDYVHNHIDYVPYFGSLKGAALTYLDGCGNDFDQASLMIALLRESGYTVQFVYGRMTIPGDQLANWLGVDTGWEVIGQVLPSGGIPVDTLNTDGTTTFSRVWVKATIDGSDYFFDPAFKSYNNINKIDLGQVLGYSRSNLLAAATAGADVGSDYVQNLNGQGLTSKLKEYSANLADTIRNQYPNSEVKEIIGGRSIIQTSLDEYPSSLSFSTSDQVIWDEVPAEYTATLRIQHVGIDHSFFIPDMAGKRLVLIYEGGDHHPELHLDGELIAAGSGTTHGTKNNFIITVDHPYAAGSGTYCDQTSTYHLESGATYTICSDFGGTSDALLRKRQGKLDISLAGGLSETSEPVLGETLNIMGLTWMKECLLTDRLLQALAETVSIRHHSVGVMAQEAGYYIDVKTAFGSIISRHNTDEDKKAHFNSTATISSAFEHGILEQLMGSDNPGISTIKLFQIANSEGSKVFFANNDNFATIKPQLQNYSESTMNDLQSQINSGRTLILPDNGQLGMGQWQGLGYITKHESGSSMSLGMIIGGGYHGGYGSNPAQTDPPAVNQNIQTNTNNNPAPSTINQQVTPHSTPQSVEPVDMAGGSYLYDRTDLALGGAAPLGPAFGRSYNSGLNLEDRGLGNGWTHNYDIRISRGSHGDPGLGGGQPVDTAAMITALYINLDLMKNQDDIQGWMVASLTNKWAVDQLIDNAITVHLGSKVMEYIKLVDNTYAPPPGITTQLVDNGDNTFSLRERFGTCLNFNTDDRIAQLTDVDNNTMTFSYSGDKLSTVQDVFGRTITLHYTGDRITSVSDSAGRSVSYSYDTQGDLVSYTGPGGNTWGYGYDASHRMTSLSDPLGITTAVNTYDSLGRVDTQTVPRQSGENVTYNFYFSGFRNMEEDPEGNPIIYYFDEKGRTTAEENALGHRSFKKYDGQGHIIGVTDPRSNTSTFVYDSQHNLTGIIDALGMETDNNYDAWFRLIETTDPLGHKVHFDYDAEHHLIRTLSYPTGGETIEQEAAYYPNGRQETATDGRGTVTTFTYDSYGNPATTRKGSHPPITYTYDPIGRMTGLTDQAGSSTGFVYDDRGLVVSKTDPLGQTTSFTYYDDGRLHTRIDRNGDTISHTYTPGGKPDTIVYPDASAISFSYDQLDHLTGMTDSIGTTSYTYDAAGRLTSLTNPLSFAVSYTYDEAGNLIELTYPGNKKVYYSYDELNRLKTVTNWLGQIAFYNYDQAGRLISLENFNSILTTYGYDNAARLIDLENRRSDTSAIATYQFSLDANGNCVQIDETAPITWAVSSGTLDYTYNDMKNRLLTAGSLSFAYDLEGQLASLDGSTYAFDYEHRLKNISGTDSIQYAYDGSGNRLEAVRDGVITRYIYDAAGNLLAEADGLNNITRYYIHGLGLLAMVTPADEIYCYHFDAIGSTIAMTDETQAMVNTYAYTPFGSIANEQETMPQSFKYVGQHGVMAEPNGFCYMRARYYDPKVGRFISEDPIGFGGGDVNLYAYVGNNPILYVDPLGLEIWVMNRKAHGIIGRLGGNHAYLWDTTANNGQGAGYGMSGSSGSGGQFTELGPGHDASRVVPGSEGREAEIIAYMEETKNTGMWFPGINDCHNKVDRTLSHFGLENPGAPGGRFGAIPNATSAGNGKNF